MKRWDRSGDRINQICRLFMAGVGGILIVLLLGKAVWQSVPDISGKDVAGFFQKRGLEAAQWLWAQSYPAASEPDLRAGSGEEGTWASRCMKLLLLQSPVYQYLEAKKDRTSDDYVEPDPAYRSYQKNREFYVEHSYLFRYGDEETGLSQTQYAQAEGAASSGGNGETSLAGGGGAVDGTGYLADGENAGSAALGQAEDFAVGGESGAAGGSPAGTVWENPADPANTPAYAVRPQLPVVGRRYVREQLADYDFLMKHFYSVHTSATAGRDLMEAEKFLEKDFTLAGGPNQPQILIYHTHSQEEFADFGPDNPDGTVVGIGSYLTELLQEKGYNVIHDTSVYDLRGEKLDRNKAYTYALEGVTSILQKYPSIEVILDVHRDGVDSGVHLVSEVNGKPTAPIMFFNGVSRTPDGPIEYLPNPYLEDNLAFSLQMQLDAAAYYPGFTRKIYIKGLRYNLHLRPRSALIEVGAQTNTYEEARNAMEPLAQILDMVLQGN